MTNNQVSYQRLDAYKVAKEAAKLCIDNGHRWRGLPGDLAPQLHRAMNSVLLNIVEATGRVTPAEQKRHYQIARGSATEVMACLEIAELHHIEPSVLAPMTALMIRVVHMLTGLIRK